MDRHGKRWLISELFVLYQMTLNNDSIKHISRTLKRSQGACCRCLHNLILRRVSSDEKVIIENYLLKTDPRIYDYATKVLFAKKEMSRKFYKK